MSTTQTRKLTRCSARSRRRHSQRSLGIGGRRQRQHYAAARPVCAPSVPACAKGEPVTPAAINGGSATTNTGLSEPIRESTGDTKLDGRLLTGFIVTPSGTGQRPTIVSTIPSGPTGARRAG
jgi:hypothetical protein